jgi:hypothetical protein
VAIEPATTCRLTNEFGACEGTRRCTEGGLTDCDAPSASAEQCNNIDDDCDGQTDEGVPAAECFFENAEGKCPGNTECVAGETTCTAPAASKEVCDGKDNDCDGDTDEGFADTDNDGDADCLDLDQDGDGLPNLTDNCPLDPNPEQFDSDGDEVGDVCDDDDDGDGVPDGVDNCPTIANPQQQDLDADGLGNSCDDDDDGDNDPDATDCSPLDPAISISGTETCGPADEDCDGSTNEVGAIGCTDYFKDADKDGVGDATDKQCSCAPVAPYTALVGGDCNDLEASVGPGGSEKCDGLDNDCDGDIDEPGATGCLSFLFDGDGDGYGQSGVSQCRCAPGAGYTATAGGDCVDDSSAINPGVSEQCNGFDDNCNSAIDEEGANGCLVYHLDIDTDGFGQTASAKCLCGPSGQFSAIIAGDCNDLAPETNPAQTEKCGGADENCNGVANEVGAVGCQVYFADSDKDTFGAGAGACLCEASATFTATNSSDCDDLDSAVNPAAGEICDGKDNNCAAGTDEGCDDDGDDFCDSAMTTVVPAPPACPNGGGDCDDTKASVRPGATEICNGLDDNCGSGIDEGCNADGDAFCKVGAVVSVPPPPICPSGPGDCQDNNGAIFPGALDDPDINGVDADCDGIDGTITKAVFVDGIAGLANAAGTINAPVKTIAQGISRAKSQGKPHVYVGKGTYTGTVVMEAGASVYGGYDPNQGWTRPASAETVVENSAQGPGTNVIAIRAENISTKTTIQRVTASAGSAGTSGSSMALYVKDASSLVVEHCKLISGNGGPGVAGGSGSTGTSGGNGQPGAAGDDGGSSGGGGGSGGTSQCAAGGAGGGGGYNTGKGADGVKGGNNGGSGGTGAPGGDDCNDSGGPGGDGGTALPGGPGAAGAVNGTLAGGLWAPAVGGNGGVGGNGRGGGGGGGGAGGSSCASCFVCKDPFFGACLCNGDRGGGGGGGGGGGCGGTGGTGGSGGGSSFGVFLFNSSPQLANLTIQTGGGGKGGNGGNGGSGGAGGSGAGGGNGPDDSGSGGGGGSGTAGAQGGGGGGGAGGSSYGIYRAGGSNPTLQAGTVTYSIGSAGAGGAGGQPNGGAAPSGNAAAIF